MFFLYKRSAVPLYSFMILNRHSPNLNQIEFVTAGLELQLHSQYLLYKTSQGERVLSFYNHPSLLFQVKYSPFGFIPTKTVPELRGELESMFISKNILCVINYCTDTFGLYIITKLNLPKLTGMLMFQVLSTPVTSDFRCGWCSCRNTHETSLMVHLLVTSMKRVFSRKAKLADYEIV